MHNRQFENGGLVKGLLVYLAAFVIVPAVVFVGALVLAPFVIVLGRALGLS
jgi:hypothetical protein